MGLVLGDAWLWVAVNWSPPAYLEFYAPDGLGAPGVAALLMAAVAKAALLWLILRPPVAGPMDRRAKALRGLLYLAVAYSLVLWIPIALLPAEVDAASQLVLWITIYILHLLVIRWRSRLLRATAAVVFALSLAGAADNLLDELDLPQLASGDLVMSVLMLSGAAATVVTVVGQWRDGRWSRGTLTLGWLSVGVYALVMPFTFLFESSAGASLVVMVVMDAMALVTTAWHAATARELPDGERIEDLPAARGRLVRVAVAAAVLLPVIMLIQPERSPRLTYTGGSADCYDHVAFGDVKPAEREATFLCRARSTMYGLPPLFPDSLSDQEILAYGRALCRAKDPAEQQAILERAGSQGAARGASPWDLVYVCPEVIGATNPELLRSAEEAQAAEAAWVAEENARCRDPWPRTKGVVQATAKYHLFADGDHGYLVHESRDEAIEGAMDQAVDDLYDDRSNVGVADGLVLVGHVADVIDLCLTVKGLRTAPPRRTAGWDQVTEVPIVSRTGRLTVPEMGEGGEVGAGAPMPNLAIAGKGRYRVRVYVRVDKTGEEQHLVVVFPGPSRKKIVLKR
ncbi:hypothetical protein [Nonomuraea sp. NPDC048826]|uniref:hypothetical protein n=1 Tax=Nonomuraea sp. NPDC048826 TaxID=3364347 RepID=UPI0037162155